VVFFYFFVSFRGLKDTPFAMYFVPFLEKEILDYLSLVQFFEILQCLPIGVSRNFLYHCDILLEEWLFGQWDILVE